MKKIRLDFILGDVESSSFEERTFNAVILIACFLTCISIVLNFLYLYTIWYDVIFLIIWLMCYYLVRFKHSFKWVSPISLLVLVVAFYPYTWNTSGGLKGSIPYYSIFFLAIICLLTYGLIRIGLITILVVVTTLLIVSDMLKMDVSSIYYVSQIPIHLSILLIGMTALMISYSSIYFNEKQRNDRHARLIEEQNKQQIYYMGNLDELLNKLKSERHDFNNHLGIVHGLIELKAYEDLSMYTEKLVEAIEEHQSIVAIPYATIRAILNYKLTMAKREQIELDIKADLPEGLSINEHDLGIVFGNLIDNALEALSKVPVENRWLRIRISYNKDYIVINMTNPYVGTLMQKGEDIQTTKEDQENHGYGLTNIRNIVNKYDGIMNIKTTDHKFVVDVAILSRRSN